MFAEVLATSQLSTPVYFFSGVWDILEDIYFLISLNFSFELSLLTYEVTQSENTFYLNLSVAMLNFIY